jgi:hypothetical protein
MTGDPRRQPRRQHFVPRLLLKGFAHRVKGEQYYVFEFPSGSEPREVNITNVGVARDFYGHPEESKVEQELSRKEAKYASLIHRLREGRTDPEQKPLIDDFVTHLIVRTKNIRDGFIEMGVGILDSLERALADQQERGNFERRMFEELLEHPDLKPLLALVPKAQRRMFLRQVLANAGLELVSACQKLLQLARPYMNVEEAAKSAQLRALRMEDALAERREKLKPLVWSIVNASEGAFVLGDLGPVARFAESSELEPPVKFGTSLEILFLPLSGQRILVGQLEGILQSVDPDTVNIASVELSRHLFVSSECTQRELSYHKRLGRRAAFLNPAEMNEGLRGVFD